MALSLEARLFLVGTVSEWDVIISNVFEEMDLVLSQGKRRSQSVDRSIAPALIEKATVLIEYFEKVKVFVGSEPVEVCDFEI